MADQAESESNADVVECSNSEDSFLLTSYLDEIDDRVENLRRRALDLQQERDSLLTVLSQIQKDSMVESVPADESQDLQVTIQRLRKRCEAVDVKVHTVRSPEQEQALSKVQSLIEDLERTCILEEVADDQESLRKRARCLLNACTSDAPSEGPIDYKFQGLILGCKLEDQKLVRRRLECLVNGRCHEDFVQTLIDESHAVAAIVSQPNPEIQQASTSCCDASPS
ncbi:hypothetical protein EGW08_012024 [Elysia chlorotica]|uniref:BAG domain-containing protein n=1 Tax=Elysia chlorotica TaxID=188477 RepID=A0A433TFB0_ELYCH|nr:hypothetical protein EGW08_012024 [Elysia chlorotica]